MFACVCIELCLAFKTYVKNKNAKDTKCYELMREKKRTKTHGAREKLKSDEREREKNQTPQ